MKKELSFHKWDGDEEEQFWIDPKYFSANKAGFRLLSAAVRKKARTHLNNTMNQAKSNGTHQLTVHNKTSDDDVDAEYPGSYKDLDAAECQKRQQEHLKNSVYIVWQALLEHDG